MMFGKKKDNFIDSGTCLWINEYGVSSTRIFKVLKVEGKNTTIGFSPNEQYVIPSKNIRVKRTVIYKTSSDKIISQDPDAYGRIDLGEQNIKIFRFNLQNFSFEEKKAALHRWTLPAKLSDKLIGLFKLLFICIAVGVVAWSAFKGMIYIFDKVMASRILDCAALIPKFPTPLGANLTNVVTAPLGT